MCFSLKWVGVTAFWRGGSRQLMVTIWRRGLVMSSGHQIPRRHIGETSARAFTWHRFGTASVKRAILAQLGMRNPIRFRNLVPRRRRPSFIYMFKIPNILTVDSHERHTVGELLALSIVLHNSSWRGSSMTPGYDRYIWSIGSFGTTWTTVFRALGKICSAIGKKKDRACVAAIYE